MAARNRKMKKNIIIYLLMSVISLMGCSRTADTPVTGGDWQYDVSLPVPIEFGAGTLTKAGVYGVGDIVGQMFGVYAVDTNPELDIEERIYLDNKAAICELQDASPMLQLVGDYYYPHTSNEKLHFYAYYPSTDNPKDFHIEDGKIMLAVYLDGADDILYASAKQGRDALGNLTDGFSGDYIRNDGVKPSFSFSHVTSGISVRVRNNTPYDLTVNSLRFSNYPLYADLCLMDSESDMEGKLIPVSYVRSYYMAENENLDLLVSAQSGPVKFHETVFVMPQESFTCHLSINGREFTHELRPGNLQQGLEGHEAGHIYRYLFDIDEVAGEMVVNLKKDVNE